jgi:hypothetical protein
MAALPPLENVCGIGSLSPAGKCLEAATAPICQHVSGDGISCDPLKRQMITKITKLMKKTIKNKYLLY